jgi:hypothetical protein
MLINILVRYCLRLCNLCRVDIYIYCKSSSFCFSAWAWWLSFLKLTERIWYSEWLLRSLSNQTVYSFYHALSIISAGSKLAFWRRDSNRIKWYTPVTVYVCLLINLYSFSCQFFWFFYYNSALYIATVCTVTIWVL